MVAQLAQVALRHGLADRLLVGIKLVHRPDRRARALGHSADGHRVVADLAEQVRGGIQNSGDASLAAEPDAGRAAPRIYQTKRLP